MLRQREVRLDSVHGLPAIPKGPCTHVIYFGPKVPILQGQSIYYLPTWTPGNVVSQSGIVGILHLRHIHSGDMVGLWQKHPKFFRENIIYIYIYLCI